MLKPFRFWSLFSRSGRTHRKKSGGGASLRRCKRAPRFEELEPRQMLTTVSLSDWDLTIPEVEGYGGMVVIYRSDTSGDLDVNYAVGGTATPDEDYVALSGTVRIPDGADHAYIDITVLHDSAGEDDETVEITLLGDGYGGYGGYVLGETTNATATIVDNDEDLPTVSVEANHPDANESGETGQFTVYRTGPTDEALTIYYTVGGTATPGTRDGEGNPEPGTDYEALGGSVTIEAGNPSATIDVAAFPDSAIEGDETVEIALLDDGYCGYVLAEDYGYGGPAAEVTIHDSDTAADDTAFVGHDAAVTIDVLLNDGTTGEGSTPTISEVTQGQYGTVTFTSAAVTYTPSSSFTSGQDTFTYTITNGNGAYDTAEVTVTLVDVTLVLLEWQMPDENWETIPESDVAWSSDTLRWTAAYSPSELPAPTSVTWYAKAWADLYNESVPWTPFASESGDASAVGSPGTGDWAIRPEFLFEGFDNQSSFCAAPAQAINKVVEELQIRMDDADISDATSMVSVGSKVAIQVTSSVPTSGVQLSSTHWSVPGTVIGGYEANGSTGTVIPVGSLDVLAPTFYWVDGGEARVVTATVIVNGRTHEVTTHFDVQRPNAQIMAEIVEEAGSVNGTKVDTWDDEQRDIRRTKAAFKPGISFDGWIDFPDGCSGTTQWVQIASLNRHRTLHPSGIIERFTGSGLDSEYPYQDYGGEMPVRPTSDSPALNLSPADDFNPELLIDSTSADDNFTMYLMFKPTGTDAIWVPLRKVQWSWSATAAFMGSAWQVTSASHTLNPTDQNALDHPQWTYNVMSCIWELDG